MQPDSSSRPKLLIDRLCINLGVHRDLSSCFAVTGFVSPLLLELFPTIGQTQFRYDVFMRCKIKLMGLAIGGVTTVDGQRHNSYSICIEGLAPIPHRGL